MPELWVEQPPDLYNQVLALGHIFTRRLDPEDQEDFKQELLLEIFSRWTEYDPSRARMSVWVTWRARGLYTKFKRVVNRRKYRQTNFEFDDADDDASPKNDQWLFNLTPRLYDEEEEIADIDEEIEFATNLIEFSDVELLVLDLKIAKRSTVEISLILNGIPDGDVEEMMSRYGWCMTQSDGRLIPAPPKFTLPHEQMRQARYVVSSVRRKLRAIQAMTDSARTPREPVENMVRLHAERAEPFGDTSFRLSTPTHGVKNLAGIVGVQEAIALSHGAASLHERLSFEIEIPVEQRVMAGRFWEKYGGLISRCSSISLDNELRPQRIVGVLPEKEAVADVLMGLTVTESIKKTERIRGFAPFKPTQQDFALLVWNLHNQGLLNGPAFDGAIESWRGRLTHGRKSRSSRITQHAPV